MDRGTLRATILVRAGKDTTSGWASESVINTFINDANIWVSNYKKWPFNEARVSTTFASLVSDEDGILRGETPEGWKSDSIRILTIGGKIVDKKEYGTFRKFLELNTSNTKRYWAPFGRSYYVNSSIDLTGTVTAYGQYTPARISNGDANDAIEIPITSLEETSEALIQEVLAHIANRDSDKNTALACHQKAEKLLLDLWTRVQEEVSNEQSAPTEGMWKRMDILGGNYTDDLGYPNRWVF